MAKAIIDLESGEVLKELPQAVKVTVFMVGLLTFTLSVIILSQPALFFIT